MSDKGKVMTAEIRVGLYWGVDGFYLAAAEGTRLLRTSFQSLDTPLPREEGEELSQDLRDTGLIQRALQEISEDIHEVRLAVAARDIIFRSFLIPWMAPEEVNSVVAFEITKYIPVKPISLAYTFRSLPVHEGGEKRIRIFFVGIRRDILRRYRGVLQQAGLAVAGAEPAAVSLTRVLSRRRLVGKRPTCVITLAATNAHIIFMQAGMVHFVRPLKFAEGYLDSDRFLSKLFNDLRVSFNFYHRQISQEKIAQLVILSEGGDLHLTEKCEEDFKIPVRSLSVADVLPESPVAGVGAVVAYGSTQFQSRAQSVTFDFLETTENEMQTAGLIPPFNVQMIMVVVLICSGVLFLSLFFGRRMVEPGRARLAEWRAKEGVYRSSDTGQLGKLKALKASEIEDYKAIRLQSRLSTYLRVIPTILPKGVWLRSWRIAYVEPKEVKKGKRSKKKKGKAGKTVRSSGSLQMSFDGYAYDRNVNEEFRKINTLVGLLRKQRDLTEAFKQIVLETTRQDRLNDVAVMYFKIGFR